MIVRMAQAWIGVETAANLWEPYPDLQVVICTAYSDYAWEDMIAKVGQSDRLVILKKPFGNVEVLQLANALTEKWRLLQYAKLKIDGLEQAVAARTQQLRQSEERFKKLCNCAMRKNSKRSDSWLPALLTRSTHPPNTSATTPVSCVTLSGISINCWHTTRNCAKLAGKRLLRRICCPIWTARAKRLTSST